MHQALARIFAGAQQGYSNTQVEFGTLQLHQPVTIKLDEDPVPLQKEEIVLFSKTVFVAEDVGIRLALIRCDNGQYLVLGEVNADVSGL